jgi:preprotein translocase subunit SecE
VSDSAGTAAAARGDDRPERSSRPAKDKGPGPLRGIALFYRQVIAELRKVVWPTRQELITYTSVVLVFVIAMVLIVAAFDYGFGKAVLAVFGR